MPHKSVSNVHQSTDAKDSDSSFLGEPDDKRLVIQMHKPMWAQLRRLAFDMDISMAELCRRGITLLLEQYDQETKKAR